MRPYRDRVDATVRILAEVTIFLVTILSIVIFFALL